ncbi:TcpQ domain-containing protein [Achromobacter xylosoxidans]|uniref:TcpQ domain-containing protein n=1 Tax=Alcaligenes xylosoxydans xylosoxydans TaxID=85698 RepID=UPI000B48A8E7|nr:TcpQ domain-containing protein [Achromobacter xylosoxidans]
MHSSALAAVLATAFLLSACGFAPPAPAKPSDTPRVAINRVDPRLADPAHKPETPSESPSTAPGSSPASDLPGNSEPTTVATTTLTSAAAIPVPEAPPKGETAPAPSAATASVVVTDTDQPGGIKVAASVAPGQEMLSSLPAATETTEEIPATEPEPVVLKEIWKISPEDRTVRQALARWAGKAGWTFGPDQWEVNFDLPIQAPAEFEAESFQEATQALSQAVAMTESPIRPCFYGNRVLRVVPFTRSCNRSPAAQS